MDESVERPPPDQSNDIEKDSLKTPGWRSLFNFTSRLHLIPLCVALILSLASGVIIPVFAIILGRIFGLFTNYGAAKISGPELIRNVSSYGKVLVGLGATGGLLNAGFLMFWLVFGELQAKDVRDKLFDGMLEKDMEWYDMRKSGIDTLISRLQT